MKRFITKTRFFALLVCILPLSVSAGELDGKSLICERVNVDIVFGYRFQKGKVKVDVISDLHWIKKPGEYDFVEGDYTIRRDTNALLSDDTYIVGKTEIRFGKRIINRQTLELIESKESSNKGQCEVFSNDDDYWKQLENIRTQKQNKADEEKTKNKI